MNGRRRRHELLRLECGFAPAVRLVERAREDIYFAERDQHLRARENEKGRRDRQRPALSQMPRPLGHLRNSRWHFRRFRRVPGGWLNERPHPRWKASIGSEQLGFSHRDDDFRHDHGAVDLSEGVAMGPLEITGPARPALGLVTGILFGFILQKAQVTKYQKIVSFFRWSDLTVQKVMFAAILVGMVGVYALHGFGLVNLHIKPTLLGANILGGLIFGVGMLLLGF